MRPPAAVVTVAVVALVAIIVVGLTRLAATRGDYGGPVAIDVPSPSVTPGVPASPAAPPAPTATALPSPGVSPTPSPTRAQLDDATDPPRDPLPSDTWSPRQPAPIALTEVAAAALAGQVWVAGGFLDDGAVSADVLVYDPAFDAWSAGPPLPEPVHHAALAGDGESLWLVGGYTGLTLAEPTAAVRRFDSAQGAWVDGPPLPSARAAGALAFDGSRLVYAGGVGPQGLAGDIYVLEGEAWRRIGALPRPREHLAAASDGQGGAFFLGGRTGGLDTNLAVVDVVAGDTVATVGEVPTARGGVGGFYTDGAGACLVGGEEPGGTLDDVECITADGTVTTLPSLASARHGLGVAVVEGNAFALLGGEQPGLVTSDLAEALPLRAAD